MDVALELSDNPIFARLVKGRLEKTTLGQVALHLRTVFRPGDSVAALDLSLSCTCFLPLASVH